MRSLFLLILLLTTSAVFSQWACYPLGPGGNVVCGWGCYSGHMGQDWQYTPNNTSYGQNIYSVSDGTIVYVETGYVGCDDPFIQGGLDWNQPSNKIIIQHSNGLFTRYVHIMDILPGLSVGSYVPRGGVIGYIGNVGPISPCDNNNPQINAHLHFEVGTGWSGNTLTGRYDPVSIFDGCYPPFCCGNTNFIDYNCSAPFSDSGGPNATYANFENFTVTVSPPNALNVSFNFYWIDLEAGYDFITLYDGPSTSDPVIGTFTGSNSPGWVTSSGPSMTFQFTSDVSIVAQGWSADWYCTYNTTGVQENLPGGFHVAPNPAYDNVFLKVPVQMENCTVTLLDPLGRQLMERILGGTEETIDLSSFPPGIYLLRLQKGNMVFQRKIVRR